jgi:hypothetical protein
MQVIAVPVKEAQRMKMKLVVALAVLLLGSVAKADGTNIVENLTVDGGAASFTIDQADNLNPGGEYEVFYGVPGTYNGAPATFDAYYWVLGIPGGEDDELYVWDPDVSTAGYDTVTSFGDGFVIQTIGPLGDGNLFITDPGSSTAAPEPSSLLLSGMGLAALIGLARRNRTERQKASAIISLSRA